MALINCQNCGKQISDKAQYCVHCGKSLTSFCEQSKTSNDYTCKTIPNSNINPNSHSELNCTKTKYVTNRNKSIVVIIVCIVLIICAISLLTTNKFQHYVENISYYTEQYEETKSHSSGFLGSSYASLASKWNSLRTEAIIYVVLHGVGAVACSLAGGIGLYKGLKKIKNSEDKYNGTNRMPKM